MKKLMAILCLMFASSAFAKDGDQLRFLPVQDGGRVKPYDTFAREMLQLVYGKTSYQGRDAHEIIFTWMLSPQDWQSRELFEVRHGEVLKQLKLDEKKRWYTGDQLFANETFPLLRGELRGKLESKEKLTPYLQALQRLENQFFIFQELAAGRLLRIVPPKEGSTWISVVDMQDPQREAFLEVTKSFINYIGTSVGTDAAAKKQSGMDLDEKVGKFRTLAQQENPALYGSPSDIDIEVMYNKVHPFRWAYAAYLIAVIFLLGVWIANKNALMMPAWIFVGIGFLIHTLGFSIRIYLSGRPPVSNMYETVIWVAWGAVLFSIIFEIIYKYRFILLAGTAVGLFSLIIADSAPAILDPSIQPLEAVLRSNYWLIIHVMPIAISYAAFFLALMLGDLALFLYLRGEEKYQKQIKDIVLAIYRSIQLGVILLAPGIILGGLWADVSWGRFWGWDPKETWALIVLLGYIAVLHGRMTTWIRDFGMVVWAIVGFNLVIMAWWGVNFVLGAGLHSYGFGAGGSEWITLFIVLHLLYVLYVYIYRRSRKVNT